jgi:hypothetical protein
MIVIDTIIWHNKCDPKVVRLIKIIYSTLFLHDVERKRILRICFSTSISWIRGQLASTMMVVTA